MVGTNVLGRASERQAHRQYEMIERINSLTDSLHTMLIAQDQMVTTLIDITQALVAKTNEIDAEVDALTARQDAQP